MNINRDFALVEYSDLDCFDNLDCLIVNFDSFNKIVVKIDCRYKYCFDSEIDCFNKRNHDRNNSNLEKNVVNSYIDRIDCCSYNVNLAK